MKKAKRQDIGAVDHGAVKYMPFRKDFYVEPPEITRMTDEEVASYRAELDGIKIRGLRCPRPIRKWTHCGLNQKMYALSSYVCVYVCMWPVDLA